MGERKSVRKEIYRDMLIILTRYRFVYYLLQCCGTVKCYNFGCVILAGTMCVAEAQLHAHQPGPCTFDQQLKINPI